MSKAEARELENAMALQGRRGGDAAAEHEGARLAERRTRLAARRACAGAAASGTNDEGEETYGRALGLFGADDAELKSITIRNLAYLYWSTGRQGTARVLYARLPEPDDGFLEFLNGIMKPYIEPEVPL